MAKLDFTRSNVAESSLEITQPRKSTFDLYHTTKVTLPIGRFIPVNVQSLMPDSVLSGTITPEFTLENVVTPEVGPVRLDTHTIAVSRRRINRDFQSVFLGDKDNFPSFSVELIFQKVMMTILDASIHPKSFFTTYYHKLGMLSVRIAAFYDGLIADSSDFAYMKDFYLSERVRLVRLFASMPANASYVDLCDALYQIALPYFGEGSNLDNCKYPIFSYYGRAFQVLRRAAANESLFLDTFPQTFTWAGLFCLAGRQTSPDVGLFKSDTAGLVAEEPLRAVWCAWADVLRNWHVENRKNLPDITQWDTTSVFPDNVDDPIDFARCVCMLVPRYRTWGQDAFTGVQTDDIWRHVSVPIMNGSSGDFDYLNSSDDNDPNTVNTIFSVLINGVRSMFPQGLFRRNSSLGAESDQYFLDLVTMQRTGMLRKFAARSYFFPDTFEGAMRAHHGIDAADLLGTTARYISGSESFLTGEQLMANVGTDGASGTPAGTRTFAGGAKATESCTFASQGDYIYLVTFASLQPIPDYDALDMHLTELTRADYPFHEFADDSQVQISAGDMIRHLGSNNNQLTGFVPRFYQYRTELDSVHGRFLTDYRSFQWLRDWYSTYALDSRWYMQASAFNIDAYGLHVHVVPDAFASVTNEIDPVAYGKVTFAISVNCPLPAAIDVV